MRVLYKSFRATFKSWGDLFAQAADFASEIGQERLITISHSQHSAEGIVTVWYWGKSETCRRCGYDLTGNTSGVCPECGTTDSTGSSGRAAEGAG
jgi:rubrerythrin